MIATASAMNWLVFDPFAAGYTMKYPKKGKLLPMICALAKKSKVVKKRL
jgi:hypothetical protein